MHSYYLNVTYSTIKNVYACLTSLSVCSCVYEQMTSGVYL